MSENCKCCGRSMIILHWNSNCDALTCNNSSCRLYRQPTPVPKGATTLGEDLGKVYSKHRGRSKGGKYAAFTFEERLQELRDEVSA